MAKKKQRTTKEEAAPPKRRRFPRITFAWLLWALLAVAVIAQAYSVTRLEWRLGQLQQSMGGIIDEVGAKLSVADQLAILGEDINELRGYFFLPPNEYGFTHAEAPASEEGESKETETARGLFAVVDQIETERTASARVEEASAALIALQNDAAFTEPLAAAGLRFGPAITTDGELTSLEILTRANAVFRRITFHRDTGEWELFGPHAATFHKDRAACMDAVRALLADLPGALAKDDAITRLALDIDRALDAQEIRTILTTRGLVRDGRAIRNADRTELVRFFVDPATVSIQRVVGQQSYGYPSLDAFTAALPEVLRNLDTSTELDRAIATQWTLLEQTLKDTTLATLLAEHGLRVADEPIVGAEGVRFPIYDAENRVVRELWVERAPGAPIVVTDGTGEHRTPLADFLEAPDPKAP